MREFENLLNSLYLLAFMVEARDPYTGGHLWRVSQFCRLLAKRGGLPPREVARIALGGFLHDLGKIAVPDAILTKAGRLTEKEYEIIKTHPAVGYRLLADHPLAALAEAAVHGHHERPDGQGYPRRLPLADIPLDARIVSVCDAFDAMTSTRPYRRGMPVQQALDIIRDNLGSQFDRYWGGLFLTIADSGALHHVVGHSDAGIPLRDCPMCGAPVAVRRSQRAGAYVYCRACGGEAELSFINGQRQLHATGRRGTAAQLAPEADNELIRELVQESARLLAREPVAA